MGDGTRTSRTTPVQTLNLTGMTAVAAGSHHGLALKSDGTVWSWGLNGYGALGDGTMNDRSIPGQVLGPGGVGTLSGVIAIAAHAEFSMALKADGTVWMWGNNEQGKLGDGTSSNRTTPVQVQGLANVVAIAADGNHSLALKRDGTVVSWGTYGLAQCGVPAGLANVVAIATGDYHSLALLSDGTLVAWGFNSAGQCDVPPGITNVVAIAARGSHSMVLVNERGPAQQHPFRKHLRPSD